MISKRRKTKTIRKNQRKRSNRVRRLHRMKMYGGAFPNDNIPLTQFKYSETRENFPDDGYRWYIPTEIFTTRINQLIESIKFLDGVLNTGKTNQVSYNREYFKEGVFDKINKNYTFKQYYNSNSGRDYISSSGFILPILKEYLKAGFTPEQLLRAELEDITITEILKEIVPNISIETPLTNIDQSKAMRKNIAKYGFTDEYLTSAGISQNVLDNKEQWSVNDTDNLRKYIKNDIFDTLRKDTEPPILPAQFIRMGFSKTYLADKGIKEIDDSSTDKINTYTLKDLKAYDGGLLVWELHDAGFDRESYDYKLKDVGFTAVDFKKSKYNLKQLIDFRFTKDDLHQDKIKFTDIDFDSSKEIGSSVEQLKKAGFDAERIFDIKIIKFNKGYTRTQYPKLKDYVDPMLEHIIPINEYLKKNDFNAKDLYDANKKRLNEPDCYGLHRVTLENILFSLLIIAGFTYDEIKITYDNIETVKSYLHRAIVYLLFDDIDLSYNVFKKYRKLDDMVNKFKYTLQNLKEIGFLPVDFFKVDKHYYPKYTLDDIKEFKSVGFSAKDFQMAHDYYLPNTSKPKASLMNDAEFTLKELIVSRNEMYDYKISIESGIQSWELGSTGYMGYTLMELKEGSYDLINTESYNVSDIFETGAYEYGEIKDVLDAYRSDAKKDNDTETIKKLDGPIRQSLHKLKDTEITVDGKKQKMCSRDSFRNTDLKCKYKPKASIISSSSGK